MRKQTLRYESEESEESEHDETQAEDSGPNEQPELSDTSDQEEPVVETRYKRVVRKPRWFRDYLSVFSVNRKVP